MTPFEGDVFSRKIHSGFRETGLSGRRLVRGEAQNIILLACLTSHIPRLRLSRTCQLFVEFLDFERSSNPSLRLCQKRKRPDSGLESRDAREQPFPRKLLTTTLRYFPRRGNGSNEVLRKVENRRRLGEKRQSRLAHQLESESFTARLFLASIPPPNSYLLSSGSLDA